MPAVAQPPNLVLVVIDDAGLLDVGAYGGEIATPTIDALARRGTRFTQYRTSPLCAPSRAMLLTGLDSHRTGIASIPEILPPEQADAPGYGMRLADGVQTVATQLRGAGYRTLMTGKWHLGHGDGDLPDAHGFDRSFALDASGADNWTQAPYMPYYDSAPWFEDGEPATLPPDFYSSRFIVNQMVDYLDATPAEQPFFAYLAFQAIHIPVQAPAAFIDPYRERYRRGWEVLRAERAERARAAGLIPRDAPTAPLPPAVPAWDGLTDEEQQLWAARMAANAGMMTAMDHELGRFIDALRQRDLAENTVFVIVSDNGPEPTRADDDWRMRLWLASRGYRLDAAKIGGPDSYAFIGPGWAAAAASPLDRYKFTTAEGGVRVPLVIAGASETAPKVTEAFTLATDIAPTLLELAGLDEALSAMDGRSLLPVLRGEADRVYGLDEAVGLEVAGNAALYRGRWKLVRNLPPWGDGHWQLYDLAKDPGETRDLAGARPALRDELAAAYARYAGHVGVQPMPAGYSSPMQLDRNATERMLAAYAPRLGAVAALLLIAAAVLLGRQRRSK
ncbi:Arylsulfatase [Pseudohaliea rubra DSM 19751]|uniref:Arylsulfatase n=2 Tax=Pseudohaliea TaxID=1341120 RepID=A0A095VPY9_9GAMM|nr:Arylsulfatase [Pseudohaliea rubra DSM 19751]